jgi:phosphatidylcholine synthase
LSAASERPGSAAAAWAAHAFTASGAVLGFLALMAVFNGDFRLALGWLLAALAVDGVDGYFARRARVRERAPRIDGATLDLVIDYLNYVFVPAALIWRAELVPEGAAPWLCGLILVSALYNFARTDMKSEDWYFLGFPALWNVIALYLLVGRPGEGWGAAIVCLSAVLTFAPVHFVHPFRVRDYGYWLPALATAWAGATAALLLPGWPDAVRTGWLGASLGLAAVLLGLGLLRTLRGPRQG